MTTDPSTLAILMKLLVQPPITNLLLAHGLLTTTYIPSSISAQHVPYASEIEGYATMDPFGGSKSRRL
ncbi:hypothetical protein FRX31_015407 [Thalictrum thalictroides]|uniref:Uncharacterized protein n=1 Tax=Thalictrum thalictroides TaxID=46969 RepID=A0A7J6WDM0_THATH|nr:hypothetical protein FRX31_015407 [Thalictrum thalictroides]